MEFTKKLIIVWFILFLSSTGFSQEGYWVPADPSAKCVDTSTGKPCLNKTQWEDKYGKEGSCKTDDECVNLLKMVKSWSKDLPPEKLKAIQGVTTTKCVQNRCTNLDAILPPQ